MAKKKAKRKASTKSKKPKQTIRARRARQDRSRGQRPLLHYLVSELMQNTELLDKWSRRRDTGHRMREWSPDIGGIFEEFTQPVRSARVVIDPPLDDDTPGSREEGRRIETAIKKGDGIYEVLGQTVETPWDGHILLELTGTFGVGDPSKGEDPIHGVWRVPNEALRYDKDGSPMYEDDGGRLSRTDGEADAWRFIAATWGYTVAGDPRGYPLKHRCFWAWHFLTFGKKFWLTALERFGMPTLFVKVMGSEWEAQRDSWLEIINDFVSHAGVVYPGESGDEVTLKNEGARTFPAYKEFVEEFRQSLRFAILGQAIPPEAMAKAPATAGRLQAAHVTDKQWDLVAWVERVLNRTLIRYVSELVLGSYKGHRIRLDLGDPRDVALRLQQHNVAVQSGLKVRKSEVYDTVGYTPPGKNDKDEDLLDLTQAPGAGMGGVGALGGGLGFPGIGFAETIESGGQKLVAGRSERSRLLQASHLADVAATEGAIALAGIAQTLRERARPFDERAASPPSETTPPS